MTIVPITHSEDLGVRADRIIRMEDGRMVGDGPSPRLSARQGAENGEFDDALGPGGPGRSVQGGRRVPRASCLRSRFPITGRGPARRGTYFVLAFAFSAASCVARASRLRNSLTSKGMICRICEGMRLPACRPGLRFIEDLVEFHEDGIGRRDQAGHFGVEGSSEIRLRRT